MTELNPTDLDAAQAAQEESAKEQAKRSEYEIADFKKVIAEPFGMRFVWRLMRDAGLVAESDNLGHAEMAYEKGKRETARKLMFMVLAHAPEAWVRMIKDQKKL